MPYLQRRNLRGLALKRFVVVLPVDLYRDLLAMKGSLGNSAAIELLVREKKRRMAKRAGMRVQASALRGTR